MKRINMSTVSAAIAVTALFIAVGGPAQAASLITGAKIKNGTIRGIDVKNNSLTGLDIKDLRQGDFRKGDLDGLTRWVLVNRAGAIEAQSGGFRIANAYPAGSPGEGNVYIDSGDANLSNNGIVASIALENQYSLKGAAPSGGVLNNGRNPEADNNPEFSGEISATRCNIASVVACAPLDATSNGGDNMPTNRDKYFVVSPRNSNGGVTSNDTAPNTGDNTHKRFYVIVSGPRD